MKSEEAKPVDMKDGARNFALRVIKVYGALPKTAEARVIGKQLLRSGTAVGANYREGLRSRSKSEYAAELNIGLMELEETTYWFELLEGTGIVPETKLSDLKREASEIRAILVTLIKKAKMPTSGLAPQVAEVK